MKTWVKIVVLAGASLYLAGCASKKNATIMPGANLGDVKNYYVVHLPADDRRINHLITEDLIHRGLTATTGESNAVPAAAEALVTYYDKWVWDMTMYMLQLDLQIRNPQTQVPLATGMAMHTSLVRKSPEEMVKEVLDEIFTKAGVPAQAASKK